jgi:peroxiredoxin
MKRHVYTIASLLLFCAVVAANVAIKPGMDPRVRQEAAAAMQRSRDWSGRAAPDFEIPLVAGGSFRLADHAGEMVVLHFFFTYGSDWPYLELAELQRFVELERSRGVPISLIAIDAVEQREAVAAFADRNRTAVPIGFDGTGWLVRLYDLPGLGQVATTFVIGADGRVKLYSPSTIYNAEVALRDVVAAEFTRISREQRR